MRVFWSSYAAPVVLYLSLLLSGTTVRLCEAACSSCVNELLPGQYYCDDVRINQHTQTADGCTEQGRVNVTCYAAPNVTCSCCASSGENCSFSKEVKCRYVNGQRYNYFVAVSLSLFLGMFGIDRFYLGYPAIGLAKLCTLGFLFIGQLIDFLLIALQVVGPSDLSEYYIPFYGPILNRTALE